MLLLPFRLPAAFSVVGSASGASGFRALGVKGEIWDSGIQGLGFGAWGLRV